MDAPEFLPPDPNPMENEENNSEEIPGFNCVGCSETFQYMQEAQNHFFQFHSFSQKGSSIQQNPSESEETNPSQSHPEKILFNEDEEQPEGK